jgi:hypothetical protein
MHANKMNAQKRQMFNETSSFYLKPLAVEIHRRSPRHMLSNDIPKIKY